MRILLINQYAGGPSLGMEYRPHWMATEWQRLGHDVLVVAGSHSHLRRKQPAVGISMVDDVSFLTLRTLAYGENGPRRFANILVFRMQLKRISGGLRKWAPDVVIASSTHPMDVRPALRVAKSCDALFVHEVHDLWPLTPRLLGGMSDRHPMIAWMQREEDLACREADLVVSMLPGTLPYLESRGLDPERWLYVSNGVPLEALADDGLHPPDDGVFRLGYFGAHGPANDLATLIAAAGLLDDALELHLWGSGPTKPELRRQAEGLSNVYFHDPVSPRVARSKMATMDALYIGLASSELFAHGVSPNKMFDYMAAGRPIVQAIDTPLSPAEEAGCAIRCSPGDPNDVAQAIRRLKHRSRTARDAMGRDGREYVRCRATHPGLASALSSELLHRQAERKLRAGD